MIRFFSLIIVIIIFSGEMLAQKAEQVLHITREIRSYEWYEAQSKLWKAEIDRDTKNDEAWINYYEANRAAGIQNAGKRPVELDEIMEELKRRANQSFAFHFLTYRNASWQEELFPHLKKAWAIRKDFAPLAEEFVSYYEYQYDLPNRKKYNQHWFRLGEMPQDLLTYNYNVLMSLEKNAILFTNGDNDTYPIWMLQDVQGVRTDVIVLNRSLANLPDYLDRVLEKNQIKPFANQKIATPHSPNYLVQLIEHLKTKSNRPIYFALTVSPDVIHAYKKNLYITGLASKYSQTRFDNMQILAAHFEKDFLLDDLKINFTAYAPYSSVKMMRQGYVTPFLSLHRHYQEKGKTNKAKEVKSLLLNIAKGTKYEAEIIQSLN